LKRDEFLEPIKLALAKRASFVCSNPDCRALTVAPADSDAKSVLYIGKAAHICAAATGGPRFDQNMTAVERSSIENAIFLCGSCADMIDRNGGQDFSVADLHHWKKQHEEWVRAHLNLRRDAALTQISGTHEAIGVGEVTALDIQGPAIIKPGTISRAAGTGNVTATRVGPVKGRS
jgi:hypothetical protein